MKYEHVVFQQGDDANETLEILYDHEPGSVVWCGPYTETIAKAIAHLQQWDNGDGEILDESPAGTSDRTIIEGDYVLTWSLRLGYVGLVRIVRDEPGPAFETPYPPVIGNPS